MGGVKEGTVHNLARFGSLLETGAEEKSTIHTYTCMHM